jgi:poly(A) polymerase
MWSWIFPKKNPSLPKNFRDLLDSDAVEIVKRLQEGGFETYLVGGCVRDLLLGHKPKDFDIATSATPQQVKALVKRSFIIGRRFRIVVAKRRFRLKRVEDENSSDHLFPNLAPAHEKEIQITTFRRDPTEKDGVINENVFGTAEQDAVRRDFTLNALFLDPTNGKIIDFCGGAEDLAKRPVERFREDPIRILRALRFMARGKLKFDPTTGKALHQAADQLALAKKERVREEILKMLKEGTFGPLADELRKLSAWPHLSPALSKHFDHHPEVVKELRGIADVLSHFPWADSRKAAPLFVFLLHGLTLEHHRSDRGLLPQILEDLKVSRVEREEMDRIRTTLGRVLKDPKAEHAARTLQRNAKAAPGLVQAFFVLKVLSDAEIGAYKGVWKAWEKPWRSYLGFVRSIRWQGPDHPGSGGGGGGSSSRRRRGGGGGGRRRSPLSSAAAAATPTGGSSSGDPGRDV